MINKITKEIVDNCLISSYRKLREKPQLAIKNGGREFIGIFVNYIYKDWIGKQNGLDTITDFKINIVYEVPCIVIIKSCSSYKEVYRDLKVQLEGLMTGMQFSDYHSLYLRSSFEDPINDYYGDKIANDVISVSHFLKTFKT